MTHTTNEVSGNLYITWDNYNKKIEELATQIHEDGFEFNQIVCIVRLFVLY